MHIQTLQGQVVRHVEWIEPWVAGQATAAVCGAVVLRFDMGVLLCLSRDRFGSAAPRQPALAHALVACAYEPCWWPSRLAQLLERSRACGYRQVVMCRPAAGTPDWPVAEGARFVGATVMPDAITLRFSGQAGAQHIVLQALPAFDCGLSVSTGPVLSALNEPRIQWQGTEGEYAWLHPLGRLPLQWDGRALRSAGVAHWPLSLRRSLRARGQRSGHADDTSNWYQGPAAQQASVLAGVDLLMRARFIQNPWLYARLQKLTRCPFVDEPYADVVATLLPGWQSTARQRWQT